MKSSRSVCVFCGSSPSVDPVYFDLARAVGRGLALARGEKLPEVAAMAEGLLRHAPGLPIVGGVRRDRQRKA